MKNKFLRGVLCLLLLFQIGFYSTTNASGTWNSVTTIPNWSSSLRSVSISDKIYLIGPDFLDIYDTANNTWTNGVPMPERRIAYSVTTYNNKVYVIGGRMNSDYKGQVLMYDPVLNSWTYGAVMPQPSTDTIVSVYLDTIYVIGGTTSVGNHGSVQRYNAAGDYWLPNGESYGTALIKTTAVSLDGKIYVLGGQSGSTQHFPYLSIYNTGNNTWSSGPNMSEGKSQVLSTIYDGNIYAIGGWVYPSGSTLKTEVFNPVTNTWSLGTGLTTARELSNRGSTAVTIGNSMYVIGFESSGIQNIIKYDFNFTPTVTSVTVPSYINSGNVSSTPFTINGINDTDSGQTLSYEYSWDNTNWIVAGTGSTPASNRNFAFNVDSTSRPQGNNIMYVRVGDGSTYSTTVSSVNITKDTVAPNIYYISVTELTNSLPIVSFNTNEAGILSFSGGCLSDNLSAVIGDNQVTLSNTTNGDLFCSIKVTDAAGNISSENFLPKITIDTIPPEVPTSVEINNGNTFTNTPNLNLDIIHPNESDVEEWCVKEDLNHNYCSWNQSKPNVYQIQN